MIEFSKTNEFTLGTPILSELDILGPYSTIGSNAPDTYKWRTRYGVYPGIENSIIPMFYLVETDSTLESLKDTYAFIIFPIKESKLWPSILVGFYRGHHTFYDCWGSVEGLRLCKVNKESLRQEYQTYYVQGDGEWFVTTCLIAGMKFQYAVALRTALIRTLRLPLNGERPIKDIQQEWTAHWNGKAVHQATLDILRGDVQKGIEIRYAKQTEKDWWLPNLSHSTAISQEQKEQKKLFELVEAVVESRKAFTIKQQALHQNLRDISEPYGRKPMGPSFGLLVHRFWQCANASEPSIKRECFTLVGYLLPPADLLKISGYSSVEKLTAKAFLTSKHPLFQKIKDVIEKMQRVRAVLLNEINKTSSLIQSLDAVLQAYRTYIKQYVTAKTEAEQDALRAPHPILLYSTVDECRILKLEAAAKLGPTEEAEKSEVNRGSSVVKILQDVHFKGKPHAPGVEFMVASLSSLIAGRTVTPTELLKVIRGDGLYRVYQASQTVQGHSLEDIVKQKPILLNYMSRTNFSATVLTGLLTDPQDGKLDNYMMQLRYNPDKSLRALKIIGIDNDIAFSDPVVRRHTAGDRAGQRFVNVKNGLYFFLQMDESIDSKFRTKFLKKIPELIVIEWLKLLDEKNKAYQRLLDQGIFSPEEFEGNHINKRGLQLPIKLVEGTVKKIYSKLLKIYKALKSNPTITHNMLFEQVENVLYHYYQEVKRTHEGNIVACIKALYEESVSSLQDLQHLREEMRLGHTQSMTQQVLKTATEFGFEDNRVQPIRGLGIDAISEYCAAICYDRFDSNTRAFLYEQLETLEPNAMQVFQALLKNQDAGKLCLSYILDHLKLDPHVPHPGGYLLHQAVAHRRTDLVIILLDRYRTDVHAKSISDRQRTALHMAAAHWDIAMIQVLLDRGADRNAKDQQGKIPSEVIRSEIQMTGRTEQTATSPTREQVLSLLQSPNQSAAVPAVSSTTFGFFSKPSISDSPKEQLEEEFVSFTSSLN